MSRQGRRGAHGDAFAVFRKWFFSKSAAGGGIENWTKKRISIKTRVMNRLAIRRKTEYKYIISNNIENYILNFLIVRFSNILTIKVKKRV